MKAPLPPNETERLEALRRYNLLNTPPEPEFDDLALLASQVCGMPMALVSLVDADRQWFKARVGVAETQTPRDIAFCAHAILQNELFVVPDTQADARFSDNPLVTAPPSIRFYAGAPLVVPGGHVLGTLCVIDRVPRQITPLQARTLQSLARQVVSQLELRRTRTELDLASSRSQTALEALRASEEFKTRMIECSRDCIKVLDLEGRLLSMNAGGMEVLEICELGPYLNTSWIDFWQGEDRAKADAAVAAAKNGGVGRFIGYFPTAIRHKPMWWDVVISAIRSAGGSVERLLAVSRDVTEHRRAEELLRSVVEGTAALTGSDYFCSLVRHLAAALKVRSAFVAECLEDKSVARTLGFWDQGRLRQDMEYKLADTPCSNVLQGEVYSCPQEVRKLFPKDRDLADLQAESYLGLPMFDAAGRVIGHLAILDDQPIAEDPRSTAILKVFAARASMELQRLRAEEKLRAALAEVEALKNRLHAENVYLQEEILREHNFEEMVGNDPAFLELLNSVERIAPTDATVLICGETGTGKELIARALHNRSARKDRPLVKVNCGAISGGLVESELFGHVKGAFTGAIERRVGRFELADRGTIFLDEVGELPLDTQVKLLRVLQEQEFEPVGSNRTVKVDVRVLAATNRNIEEAVASGRFRADLYYRLAVVPLKVPPLRERPSDIRLLVLFFVSRFAVKFGKSIEGISPETLQRLASYSWPGNVRELQNLVERAVVLSRGPLLELGHDLLPLPAHPAPASAASPLQQAAALRPLEPTAASDLSTLEQVQRRHILTALAKTRWVIEGSKGAAVLLGLHPNTLRSRMKKLGIRRAVHELS
jgi:transcriptional regulator with GAF, ATPase, and Fis domain